MNVIRFFSIIIRTFPFIFLLNVFVLCLTGGIESLSIFSVAPIFDSITDPSLVNASDITKKFVKISQDLGIEPTFYVFAAFFLTIIILKAVLNLVFKYVSLKTKYKFLEKFMVGSFSTFFNSGLPFFNSVQQGVLLNTFNSEISTVGNSISSMSLLFSNFIRFLFFIIIPFTISVKLTLFTMLAFAVVSLPSFLTDRMSLKMGVKNVDTANRLQIVLQESLSSVKVILGFGNVRKVVEYYRKHFHIHKKVTIPFQMMSFSLGTIYEPILMIILFVVLYTSLHIFQVKLPDVLVIMYAFKSMVPLILAVMTEKNNISGFIPSYEQVERLEKQAQQLKIPDGSQNFSSLKNSITFKDVQFSYHKTKQILHGLSLEIPKGKMVALVGRSGSGKTTIVDLAMGFYFPDQGDVLIDDQNLKNLRIESFRSRIGFVSQDPVLFNQTIKENLLWSKADATDDEINEALRLSHATNFIQKMPEGINTAVGDRGAKLSGGERQRIAFARAILRKPDLLILDEATSALDSESEKAIQDAIHNVAKKCTTLVIAHRLSTIKEADIIYVIDQGKVVEKGSYQELIKLNGVFASLAQKQLNHET